MRSDTPIPAAAWGAATRHPLGFLTAVANITLGPTDPAVQRQDVIRRALIVAMLLLILPIQELRIPGWPAVVGGCLTALAYDVPLAYLVYAKQKFFAARVLGLVLDSIVLMGASLYVFYQMGAVNSSSDIWLVFLVYIITGGFTMAPVGSLLYTTLWMAWFALATFLYFPASSQFHEQLPIRLFFFAAFGLISLGMAAELQKRRTRLEVQNRQTMGMLAKLVEARDTDAGAHLHRIQHFSRALALHVGLSQREAQEIAYASLMHDVGKANVPDAILKKPGPLSADDWVTMQHHTLWGEDLLAENQDFDLARQVARWHHEHWDGRGYPDGLRGPSIPLPARIVSVADVFDALISERPYKRPWPHDAAMEELQRIAGSQLDPDVVAAFADLYRRGVIDRISRELDEGDQTPSLGQAA